MKPRKRAPARCRHGSHVHIVGVPYPGKGVELIGHGASIIVEPRFVDSVIICAHCHSWRTTKSALRGGKLGRWHKPTRAP